MVHEREEALNIIEDMTEEQIISMEDADEGDGEEAQSLDIRHLGRGLLQTVSCQYSRICFSLTSEAVSDQIFSIQVHQCLEPDYLFKKKN